MDLRVEKTRESIFNAYIELRKEKALEKISIKELTERARISKQTFYLHYKDIHDLTNQVEGQLIDHIIDEVTFPEKIIDNLGKTAVTMLKAATSQGPIYKIIFSGSRMNMLVEKLEVAFKNAVYKMNPLIRSDLKMNLYLTFLIQGCYHTYKKYSALDQENIIEMLGYILTDISDYISDKYVPSEN